MENSAVTFSPSLQGARLRFSARSIEECPYKSYQSTWRISDFNWNSKSELSTDQLARAHHLASQGMFTEEAGLLVACNLARLYDDRNTRRLLSRQASDEAKHSEVFETYVTRRFGTPIPRIEATNNLLNGLEAIEDPLRLLLAHTLLEGLALDEFRLLQEDFNGDLLGEIYQAVRTDEARHVSIGVYLSRSFVAKRTQTEAQEMWRWCVNDIPRFAGLDPVCAPGSSNVCGPEGPGMVALLTRRFIVRCRQIFRSSTGVNDYAKD